MRHHNVTMLLPTTDNDGNDMTPQLSRILGDVLRIAGGYTSSDCGGVWRDSAGREFIDTSLRVEVSVPYDELETLGKLRMRARFAREELRQECIYFSVVTADVELI